jgi:lipoyl(octanoyl) transferase
VWVEDRKIASIGVHVAHGVTTHGFAINVAARAIEPFTWVIACGLPDVTMTAIESERGDASITVAAFGELAAASLAGALGHDRRPVSREALEAAAETNVSTL